MAHIENFKVPVSADSLSNAELLITTALLVKGNYSSSSRVYISFCASNNYEKAMHTLKEAFYNLDLPLSTIASDQNELHLYTWGNGIKKILAKQQLLPSKSQKWTKILKIPTSWHSLPNSRRILINNFIYDLAKQLNIRYVGSASRLPNNDVLARGLLRLLRPINPDLSLRYLGSEHLYPVLCGLNKFDTALSLQVDDFSDLM